ncbi:hypothetical protein J4727_18045 [Providencia rettgeri]|uniref:Uncharacterized protein n=1 Tax=Providencia rettgeri TaxID=587 RepID=A0A939NCL3_PRORE|nr:hypothetical protein [Providencia rettgeri]
MQAHIQTIKAQHPQAKIVVVTGGFHTLALLEGLEWLTNNNLSFQTQQKRLSNSKNWVKTRQGLVHSL